jgi:hypothetical protein
MGDMGRYRERGGCLSAFLVFAMIADGLRLLGGLLASGSAQGDEQMKWLGVALVGGVGFVVAWQVWRWQRWAVHAWLATCLIGAVIDLTRDQWPWAAAQVAGGLLFGALVAGNWSGFGDPPREPEHSGDDTHDDDPKRRPRPVAIPPKRPAAPKPTAHADERACPQCKAAVPLDAKFCDACGKTLANECPKCGQANRSEARFCKHCGAGLVGPEIVQDSAPPEEPSGGGVPVDRLIECPACGTKNRAGALKCAKCGEYPLRKPG